MLRFYLSATPDTAETACAVLGAIFDVSDGLSSNKQHLFFPWNLAVSNVFESSKWQKELHFHLFSNYEGILHIAPHSLTKNNITNHTQNVPCFLITILLCYILLKYTFYSYFDRIFSPLEISRSFSQYSYILTEACEYYMIYNIRRLLIHLHFFRV